MAYTGETAYVITENPEPGGSGFWLWNPSTGLHYSQYQPHIPLISVGCVFNDKNVSTMPTLIDWGLAFNSACTYARNMQ